MPNETSFSANTAGAHVAGTLRDNLPINPNVPPMGLQAIGARVTLAFKGLWDADASYMYYDVVHDAQGASYIGKAQAIPAGTALSDTDYWIRWADPNAQYEELEAIVNTFNGRITQNASDIVDEATARETADTQLADADIALSDRIDAKPDITATNFFPTEKADVPSMFPYNSPNADYPGTTSTKHIHRIVYGEDNSLKQALYAAGCNQISTGNLDICWVNTIANSYLMNADALTYGNVYTACSYEGTFDNPVLIDPKAHKDENDKMQIDCRAFAELVMHGIPYNMSIYTQTAASQASKGFNPAFNPTAPIVKEYWKHGPASIDTPRYNLDIGWGHLVSDSMAKFFYDAGRLDFFNQGVVNQIEPGYIYFQGDMEGRFFGISHCYVCVGSVGALAYRQIIAESNSPTDVMNSRFLNATKASQTVARYLPPSSSVIRNGTGTTMQTRATEYRDRNLSTNPLTWNETAATIAARVLAIKPSNTASGTFTFKCTNNATGESITDQTTIYGNAVYILPYGWTVELTSGTTTQFDIITQCVCSDNLIKLA